MKAINTDENIFYLGNDKCEELKDEGKCGLSFRCVKTIIDVYII